MQVRRPRSSAPASHLANRLRGCEVVVYAAEASMVSFANGDAFVFSNTLSAGSAPDTRLLDELGGDGRSVTNNRLGSTD